MKTIRRNAPCQLGLWLISQNSVCHRIIATSCTPFRISQKVNPSGKKSRPVNVGVVSRRLHESSGFWTIEQHGKDWLQPRKMFFVMLWWTRRGAVNSIRRKELIDPFAEIDWVLKHSVLTADQIVPCNERKERDELTAYSFRPGTRAPKKSSAIIRVRAIAKETPPGIQINKPRFRNWFKKVNDVLRHERSPC
jgi:hypothetical protein